MRNISKEFPGVKALDSVSIDIYEGEVHAIVGENGAGKSTLMKILAGLYRSDNGEILINKQHVQLNKPIEAIRQGVVMVHQELMSVMEMTIAENIFLGREPRNRIGLVDRKKLWKDTQILVDRLNINARPGRKMATLSVAQRQLVEIAKAISFNAKIIIMDEPTSAITGKEIENLFQQIRALKAENITILYITHKLSEIFEITDRVTVLRDGRLISSNKTSDMSIDLLIKTMVGRELNMLFPPTESSPAEVYFSVENLTVEGLLDGINLSVRRGEIFGIAGLMGAGRTEVVESVFGLRKITRGTVIKAGNKLSIRRPVDAIKNGIALLPEDRKQKGLNLIASVKDNISIVNLQKYTTFGLVNRKKEKKDSNEMIKKLRIKTQGLKQIVSNLSGGNQQKIVVAKWLLKESDVILLDDPTRGIDVNAKYEIYALIRELAKQGKAIVLISSEMPEIIGLCDRVMVMYEGRVTGQLERKDLSQELIMRYASGITA